jgi:predicted DsbA family dithiol-disulfide isomerase
VFDRRFAVSGAQSVEAYAQVLDRVVETAAAPVA